MCTDQPCEDDHEIQGFILDSLIDGGVDYFRDLAYGQLLTTQVGETAMATGQRSFPLTPRPSAYFTFEALVNMSSTGSASLSFGDRLLWAAAGNTPSGVWEKVVVPVRDLAGMRGPLTFALSEGAQTPPGSFFLFRNTRLFDDGVQAEARGDVNLDGVIDGLDVPAFVGVLLGADTDPVHVYAADMNGSDAVDSADVPLFVSALLAG